MELFSLSMQKNYKQVMQGIGGRQTQRPAGSASTSKSVPNTSRGKHKKKIQIDLNKTTVSQNGEVY